MVEVMMAPILRSTTDGELSAGYKLVPWSSWAQWHFVRESIFSTSPDDVAVALRRISAWRSRGTLPVPIDVTAAFVEIQQKDPFFRKDAGEGLLESEEMLSMLYSMAIIRLVNCFVEPSHKRRGGSISRLAYEIGLPRTIVDIRHESSHRYLPSLNRVRIAVVEALDWLKNNYWERQKNMIPDVQDEVRSRLREITYYLKTQKPNVDTRQGRPGKHKVKIEKCISKLVKIVARLYSTYPSEVVSVLLEFFQLQSSDFSGTADGQPSGKTGVSDEASREGLVHSLKIIITRISNKRPGLLLSILKNVLETIEANIQDKLGGCDILSSTDRNEAHMRNLCSFVHWLIVNIKTLKDSGSIGVVDKCDIALADRNLEPKFSLFMLLRKCLALSVLGDKHILDSAILLVKMIKDKSVKVRLMKLPHMSHNWDFAEDPTYSNMERVLSQEEDMIRNATDGFENVKLRLKARNNINTAKKDDSVDSGKSWTVAKSWIPCPIGMLPCFLSSTAVLPADLDSVDGVTKSNAKMDNDKSRGHSGCPDENVLDYNPVLLPEDETPAKRLKPTMDADEEMVYHPKLYPVESQLLMDGAWEKVSQEDLPDVGADIRIFEQQ